MSAHLRPLPRCRTCGAPATEELFNGVNARSGVYCTKHASKALKDFQRDHETPSGDVRRSS